MPQLSEMDVIKMREMVAQYDAEQEPIRVIDLNNPPRAAYRYQKFPMIVYDLQGSSEQKIVFETVRDQEELEAHLEAGWSQEAPSYSEYREEALSAAYQMEAENADAQLVKRKPGRPKVA